MSNNTNYSSDKKSEAENSVADDAKHNVRTEATAKSEAQKSEAQKSEASTADPTVEKQTVPGQVKSKLAGKATAKKKEKPGGRGKKLPGAIGNANPEVARRIAPVFVDFQPDAVELEAQPIPGRLRWVLYTVSFLILTTAAWAYWTEIEMFVSAQGQLVPTTDPIMIQAASGSPIKEIHVRFGDVVQPGQLLATLDSTVPVADENGFRRRLNSSQARKARLKAEQAGAREFSIAGHEDDPDWLAEQSLFQSRWLAYENQLDEIAAEIEGYEAQIVGNNDETQGLRSSLAIHEEVEETMRKLQENGSQSKNNYLSQKLNRQEVALKIVKLINDNSKLEHQIDAAQKRRQRATAERTAEINNELVKTQNEMTVLETDLEKAVRARELSRLYVPSDTPYQAFYVLEASDRTMGSVVRETDPLFKLMPLDDKLRVEAEIQGKDIGDVRLGDPAIIKLDALPYQRHGTLKGELTTISEGSFEKKEGAAESSFFKSYVTLTERRIDNPPEGFRLVPGMTCKVELRVGKRRVIDYFLYPLIRHLDQSLREPSARPQQQSESGEAVNSRNL